MYTYTRQHFKGFEQLPKEFDLEKNDFFQIFANFRDYYDKKCLPERSVEGNAVIKILFEAYKKKGNTIISKMYQGLQKQNGGNTGYVKAKWRRK